MSVRKLIAAGAALAVGAATLVAGAAVSAAETPHISGGETVPAYDYAQAIHEHVYVQTPLDTDKDGKRDKVSVDLIRPREADEQGTRVPVIIQASPYNSFSSGPDYIGEDGRRIAFDTWLDNYFVPRGYAFAYVDLTGTFRSNGCNDVGGPAEVASAESVVDWLNGRAEAQYAGSNTRAVASWSTGDAGMIGVSWNGTIANSVAATGVTGLRTIVPIAAISSWYDYTRDYGTIPYPQHVRYLHQFISSNTSDQCLDRQGKLQRYSDDTTGSYSDWWAYRDYVPDFGRVKASVYAVHGLQDENVDTKQFGQWWEKLSLLDVPRKVWLSQDQHDDPFVAGERWVSSLHRWFDYWLQHIDNGVMDEPMATIQREDGSWEQQDTWPAADAQSTTLRLSAPWSSSGAGGLSTGAVSSYKPTYTIAGTGTAYWPPDISDPTAAQDNRVVLLSNELSSTLRLSGTAELSVRVKVDSSSAGIRAGLVDYGDARRYVGYDYAGETCWGGQDENDNACYSDAVVRTQQSSHDLVVDTAGDIGHYTSMRELSALSPGQWYDLKLRLDTDDVIFAAGHRIGLSLSPAYPRHRGTEPVKTHIQVDLAHSTLTMPVSGDVSSLATPGPVPSVDADQPVRRPAPKTGLDEIKEFVESSR